VSPILLTFIVGLILRNKKKSGGEKSRDYMGGGFNSGFPCFSKNCSTDTTV
jgi:hypothetical protein